MRRGVALLGVSIVALLCAACGSATKTVIIKAGSGGATTTTVGSSAITVTAIGGPTRAYRVPSPAMEPTIKLGQRIVVSMAPGYIPRVGDIVVFHPPAGADPASAQCGDPNQGAGHSQACDQPTAQESSQTFIKRVVAGPGDVIRILGGHVYRNGVREDDSYTNPCNNQEPCNFPTSIKVPPGDYFMMGDNRGESDDSRFWGPVPDKWIIGVAFFTYWPPDRIGTL
jgi:signal peptidase I